VVLGEKHEVGAGELYMWSWKSTWYEDETRDLNNIRGSSSVVPTTSGLVWVPNLVHSYISGFVGASVDDFRALLRDS
jgi:hypothetical protein